MKQLLLKLSLITLALLPIAALAQPVASFTANPSSGCSPLVVQFNNTSTGATSYSWNLGNSVTSTQANPSTTYVTAGTYTVTLTASNGSQTNTITHTVTVHPAPVVNFVANDSNWACPTKVVNFTNLSIPGGSGPNTYYWDFGNGTTSTLQNPTAYYSTSGNFNVSLIVTNGFGCSKTFTKNNYIHTYSEPVANFSSSTNNSCSVPATVNFTNTSTGAVSYQWSFGNSQTSTQQNPSCTYTTAGTYTVRLIATNSNGCKDTLTMTNYVNVGNVDAQFNSPSSVCVNNPITFTNVSTPGPGNSYWLFGDGNSSSQASPTHTYTSPGTYTVKLVVSSTGCSDSITHTVVVAPGPSASFTGTPTTGCVPLTVNFTNTSTGANSYAWTFGNTQTSTATNPSTTYTIPNQTYTVKLVAISNSGCTDTQESVQYITTITPIVTVSATPQSGCAPFTTTFLAQGINVTLLTYNWTFGDGSPNSTLASPTHVYNTPGNYTATLNYTASGGCSGSVQYLVQVGTSPNANFSVSPTTVCPNVPVTFTNLSTGPVGTNYLWLFGDGTNSTAPNPTHAYTLAIGWMTVTLIATSNGCSDTFVMNNAVNVLPPYANFNFSVNCSNKFFVTFTDQSQGANTWLWNFGDGTPTSNTQSPTHLYAAPGLYNVKLVVTNIASGCLDSVTIPVRIFQDIANFTISDTMLCEYESLTLSPVVNQFAIYNSYLWNFGDGTIPVTLFTSSTTQPHIYTTANNYVASLIVTDIYNCKDTMYKNVHVGGPVPNFTASPTSGCAPLTVQFQDFSATTGSTITSRAWYFGDGGTLMGNVPNPSHVYVNAGTYDARIFVTDAVGCTDSMTIAGITANKPHAGFYSLDTITCPGQPVDFVNTSVGVGNLTYAWTFGDGGTSTQLNPSHTYSTNGNFTVRLIVTDGNGCKDTLIMPNYVHSSSIGISFTMSNDFAVCPPLAVNFTNTSSGSISSFSWSFGNGGTSNVTNPSALYTYPGVYVVTLTGQSTSGCILTTTDTVTVLGPTANLVTTGFTGCAPLTVQFNANAQGATSITWDFNDGNTQITTGSNVTHTYLNPGVYVPLIILSNGSCNVTIPSDDTVIAGNLNASFTYAPATLCAGGTVQFNDTVTGNTNGLTHAWLFGDGGTSTLHNPSHVYTSAGTYQVRLIMGNSTNCYDTVIQSIVINPLPNVNAGPDQAICAGQNTSVQLNATGAQTYTWTPATGLSCTNCANPVASPSTNMSYVVTGTSALGCIKKDTVLVNVNTPPNVTATSNTSICQGGSTQLNANGAASYVWAPSTGLSCTTCQSPTASPTTTTTYSVIGTNQAGCKDTAYVTITVNTAPTVIVAPNQTLTCQGTPIQLQASGAQSYSWSPSTGLSCNLCANPIATPAQTTTYVVTGIASNGCPDTAHATITLSIPPVSAGPDVAVCDGFSAQLQASGAVSYVWSPATGLSCTNCPNPTVNISTSTTYTVTGTDSIGCTATDQAFVNIGSIPVVSGGADVTICEGDATQLQASGANTYVWTPSTGLSCTNCANPTATPTSTITYSVAGTNTSGCVDSANVTITVNPAPVVNAGNDHTLCESVPAQLLATGAVSYSWSPGTGLSCTNCDNPVATPTTTTTYTVTGTGSNGCTATDDVIVNIVPAPAVDAGADVTICSGNALHLHATGADTYVWSPATDLTCTACPDPVATPTQTIVYTVVGTDPNGCSKADSIAVTVLQRAPVSVGADDSICVGQSTQLSAEGGNIYTWLPAESLNDNHSATPVATPTVTTTYMVIIEQQGCFADTAYTTVVVSHPPSVNLGPDREIVAGGSIELNAEGTDIYSYAWDNTESLSCSDCKNPTATPKLPTVYIVTVSNEFGCKTTDDISIDIRCDNSQAFIPNTFTPNNDGQNDKFFMSGKGIRVITKFSVWNRWGQEVFSTTNIAINDPRAGWDGTVNGKPLDPDVFVYMIEAICDLGDVLKYKGDISLIR